MVDDDDDDDDDERISLQHHSYCGGLSQIIRKGNT
jgi:hypothetical protein